ncbi:MAG TPA: homoserine kinase [Vicinamibacterales bacterium]|nr:homoserine kinase [Vicinamibacterales bacterium]
MIAAFAPATVSNVACGFDVLGFALDEPGDIVMAAPADAPGVSIVEIVGDDGRLPMDARRNTAGAAVEALLSHLQTTRGVALRIHKGLPLESGIGSSGASAVAAVVAANELLGRPAATDVLLACAMAGEQVGCGAVHPDNVAPALLGGFVLARQIDPPDMVRLPVPEGLACALLHPRFSVHTGTARALLGDTLPLATAIRQWANLGALVSALHTGDRALLSRALVDVVAEPKRAGLVPGFYAVKQAAIDAGALGCSLSGSGPSMFALAPSVDAAAAAGAAMQREFAAHSDAGSDLFVSPVGRAGARVIAS